MQIKWGVWRLISVAGSLILSLSSAGLAEDHDSWRREQDRLIEEDQRRHREHQNLFVQFKYSTDEFKRRYEQYSKDFDAITNGYKTKQLVMDSKYDDLDKFARHTCENSNWQEGCEIPDGPDAQAQLAEFARLADEIERYRVFLANERRRAEAQQQALSASIASAEARLVTAPTQALKNAKIAHDDAHARMKAHERLEPPATTVAAAPLPPLQDSRADNKKSGISITFMASARDNWPWQAEQTPGQGWKHAFACLTLRLNSRPQEDCYGFYPKKGASTSEPWGRVKGPGSVYSEFETAPRRMTNVEVSVDVPISDRQRRDILFELELLSDGEYSIATSNCIDFVDRLAQIAGLNRPARSALQTPVQYLTRLKALNPGT